MVAPGVTGYLVAASSWSTRTRPMARRDGRLLVVAPGVTGYLRVYPGGIVRGALAYVPGPPIGAESPKYAESLTRARPGTDRVPGTSGYCLNPG